MKIIIAKQTVQDYVDRILDACLDTGVGIPDRYLNRYEDAERYTKEHELEMEYVWLGMWMYDKGINFDREIDRYCKKFNTHSRDASYKLLTEWYGQKEYEARLASEELDSKYSS